tara:strand:- start:576 stop:764 length:189 start_codon:yes stop_codon:yes gene_type:complete
MSSSYGPTPNWEEVCREIDEKNLTGEAVARIELSTSEPFDFTKLYAKELTEEEKEIEKLAEE